MSTLKKWIITLIVILAILLGILIYILYNNRAEIIYGIDEQGSEVVYNIDEGLQKVTVRNNFYAVKSCINKFYTYYSNIYNNEDEYYIIDDEVQASIEEQEQESIEAIYNMIDVEYIKSKNITPNNILKQLKETKKSTVNVTNMYVSEKTSNISIYLVEGTLREEKTGKISDFKIMLKVDALNRTFSVILQDYIDEKYKDLKIGENINIEVPNNIEKNEHNTYDFVNVSEETYVTDLFGKYKEEVIYNSKLAYEHLEEDYRTKRFGSYEDFQYYAKDNIRKNIIMKIDKYQKSMSDGYTQYICIDQYNNYYIFRETAVMDYTVILDTYTIDLPEFIEKYNNATENEKIQINIQKVFDAINSGDYRYVYNKLDETFKMNYFKTQEEFQKYIKEKWYKNNKVSYSNYQKNGDVYIYNIHITNADLENATQINQKILMQLKEGTDFVMSLNVE